MQSMFQARRVGPAFFDEDDVCDGSWFFVSSCLNCYASILLCNNLLSCDNKRSCRPRDSSALYYFLLYWTGAVHSSVSTTGSSSSTSGAASVLASSAAALAASASSAFFCSIFASVSSLTPRYLRRPVPAGIS